MPDARCVPSAARWGCSCAGRAALSFSSAITSGGEKSSEEKLQTSTDVIASGLESELGLLAQEICPSLKCTEVAAPGVGRAVVPRRCCRYCYTLCKIHPEPRVQVLLQVGASAGTNSAGFSKFPFPEELRGASRGTALSSSQSGRCSGSAPTPASGRGSKASLGFSLPSWGWFGIWVCPEASTRAMPMSHVATKEFL